MVWVAEVVQAVSFMLLEFQFLREHILWLLVLGVQEAYRQRQHLAVQEGLVFYLAALYMEAVEAGIMPLGLMEQMASLEQMVVVEVLIRDQAELQTPLHH